MKTEERRILDLKDEIREAEKNSNIVDGRIEGIEEELKDLLNISSIKNAAKSLDQLREKKESIDLKIKEDLTRLEELIFGNDPNDEE
jgi:hypothetical protein